MVRVDVVAPETRPPLEISTVSFCHLKVGAGLPLAAAEKLAFWLDVITKAVGWVVKAGAAGARFAAMVVGLFWNTALTASASSSDTSRPIGESPKASELVAAWVSTVKFRTSNCLLPAANFCPAGRAIAYPTLPVAAELTLGLTVAPVIPAPFVNPS